MYNTILRPFRVWCQKVLPLVYDDSLSYYELLCKVMYHLNLTIDEINEIKTILEGDGSVDELVAEAIKTLIEKGIIGVYEAGAKFTVNPVFDFNDFADELYKTYHGTDLANWNAQVIENLWDELMYKNMGIPDKYSPMFKVNAFEVSDGVYSPAYVWRARKNYQTTHFNPGFYEDDNKYKTSKYGLFANEFGGEPTYLITVGDRGGDKNNEATFYHMFKAWTEGKYNGEYILDNYNFIILPLINYLGQNGVEGKSDYLRNNFNCGYTAFVAPGGSDSASMCAKIESFFDEGVQNIMETITSETIPDTEKWRYNQNIVHINFANFTWMDNATYVDPVTGKTKYYHDDEDEFGYGIIFRGHCIRENNAEKILFDACMSVVDQVKKYNPKLYAGDLPYGTSQVHIGNNSYHSIVSASSQFAYKSLNIELPRCVGDTWKEYTVQRNPNGTIPINSGNMNSRNTFYLDLLGIYNGIIAAMNYFELPLNRVYENMWSLGFWTYNAGLDSESNHAVDSETGLTKPYKTIDIEDLLNRVPPGSICEFSIPQANYPSPAPEGTTTHLADMRMFYENLPSAYGGLLTVHKGKAIESLTGSSSSRRGKVEYTPAYGTYEFIFTRIDNDGVPGNWKVVTGESLE